MAYQPYRHSDGDVVYMDLEPETGITLEDVRNHTLPPHFDGENTGIDKSDVGYVLQYDKPKRSLTIDIKLSHPEAKVQPQIINGVIDTGAQSLCIHEDLPNKFGWKRVGTSSVSGANGRAMVGVWRGSLTLIFDNNQLVLSNQLFLEAALPGTVQALIGQPFIKNFVTTIFKDFRGVKFNNEKNKS